MVAAGDDVRAAPEQFVKGGAGQAFPAGGVLSVHHDEVHAFFLPQPRRIFSKGRPARAADNITDH